MTAYYGKPTTLAGGKTVAMGIDVHKENRHVTVGDRISFWGWWPRPPQEAPIRASEYAKLRPWSRGKACPRSLQPQEVPLDPRIRHQLADTLRQHFADESLRIFGNTVAKDGL